MKRILVPSLLIALLLGSGAQAAPTPNSVVTPQTISAGVVQFLQGVDTAGTYKTLYTAGLNGSILKGVVATSNDTAVAHVVTCQLVRSAVKYGGVAVNVPVNSGSINTAVPVNLMSALNWVGLPIDSDGNPFLYLSSGDTLQCTYATALTGGTSVSLIAVAADL